jgi:hypothetical protein
MEAMKIVFLLCLLLVEMPFAQAAGPSKDVLGDWGGESLCTIKDSPCHDEHVIYHIKPDPKDAGALERSANKVVNGAELYMGSPTCNYATAQHELRCTYKKDDHWVFRVSGDAMIGTLTIAENKLYRKISVKRKKQG